MLKLHGTMKRERGWLRGFPSRSYRIAAQEASKIPAADRTLFCCSLLNQLSWLIVSIETPFAQSDNLYNVRGRPKETFHNNYTANYSGKEELFFIEGVSCREDETDTEVATAFSAHLLTSFLETRGSSIIYRTEKRAQGLLEPWADILSPQLTLKLFPLRIDTLRFGFDYFRPSRFGSYFGITPVVASHFYLTITPEKLEIIFEEPEESAQGTNTISLHAIVIEACRAGNLSFDEMV